MKTFSIPTTWSVHALAVVMTWLVATVVIAAPENVTVYASLHEAIESSGLSLDERISGTPLSYEDGVALYHLEAVDSGDVRQVFVEMGTNPLIDPEKDEFVPLDDVELAFGWNNSASIGSYCGENREILKKNYSKCRVRIHSFPYSPDFRCTLLTDVDWNRLDFLHDAASAIETFCAAATFYEHTNFGGRSEYVPRDSRVENLKDIFFDNRISSFHIHLK